MPIIRIAILSFVVAVAFGQARKEFEVASIRPVAEQALNQIKVGLQMDGSQVRISYLSLKDYISMAYELRLNQIVGPDWLASQRFDIAAKLPEGGKQADIGEMLQSLLADRFKLQSHRETKEFPVYALEVAKGGFKVTESAPLPDAEGDTGALNISAGGNGAGATINFGRGSYFSLGPNGFEIKRLSMNLIADMLTRFLDRPVVDMTSLKGNYDLTLNLTPEDRTVMLIRSAVAAGIVLPPQALALLDIGSTASLTDAMKNVGLTLEPRRAPMEVLVVDQMEKTPTEN
jgi:uncharacterized protein (TIGR03435 family)